MEPAWEKVHGLKFQLMFREVKFGNGAVRRDPCYSLSKTECLYIATNDEVHAKLLLLRGCYKPSETWNQHGKNHWVQIWTQYLQRLYRTYMILLRSLQDGVSVYRHKVQQRGTCKVGTGMGSWRWL